MKRKFWFYTESEELLNLIENDPTVQAELAKNQDDEPIFTFNINELKIAQIDLAIICLPTSSEMMDIFTQISKREQWHRNPNIQYTNEPCLRSSIKEGFFFKQICAIINQRRTRRLT